MLPKTIQGWHCFLEARPDSFYMEEHCGDCNYFYKCIIHHKRKNWRCFKGYKKNKEYVTDEDLKIDL